MSRPAAEKIRIQRQDHIRFFRTINRVDVVSKRQLPSFAPAVADRRFPLVPFGLRIQGQQRLDLRRQRRRSDNTGQNAETGAISELHPRGDGLRAVLEFRPSVNFAKPGGRLRAIRIVKIQNGSLRECIRCAQARRVIQIAFDLGRPSFMAFYEQSDSVRPEWHHRSVKLRLAKNQAVRLLHVRHKVLLGSAAAPGEPGQRERGRHELQEIPAVHALVPFGGRQARKFAVQQLFKFRILGELLERAPILLAGIRLHLGAHCVQIQRRFLRQYALCVITAIVRVFVLFWLAHVLHYRWHVEQLTNSSVVRILYSALSFRPNSA